MEAPHDDRDRALADQLLSARGLPELAHLVLLVLVAWLVWGTLPRPVFVPWAGAVIGIVTIRALLWGYARRVALPPPTVARIVRVTMSALGLAWGLGSAAASLYLPIATLAILVMALAGLLAGGIATLAADRWTFPLYAATMFGPVLIGVVMVDRAAPETAVLVLILAFLGFTVQLHRRAHEMLLNRLQIEAELRNRERQLAAAQAIAHVGSWEWEIATNRVTWSDELYRTVGVPLGSPVTYADAVARMHPDDRARVEDILLDGLRRREIHEYECRMVRPDGAVRHLQNRATVVADVSGTAVRMVGTSLDITDRKTAEENQQTLLREVQAALLEVKTLRGILPICAQCKRIRTDEGSWEQIESYVHEHTQAQFSHGLCPECAAKTWG